MAVHFSITEAQLVGLFTECILYGVYLVTLGYCLRALLFDPTSEGIKFKKNFSKPMFIVALLLALFATLDVAFGLRHCLDAFVYYKGPGGAEEEFHDINYWVNVMKTADYVAQTFIGDTMLIYRLYVVYERSWKIIILPILLWLGGVTCGVFTIYIYSTMNEGGLINTASAVPFVNTMVGTSVVLNVFATSFIVWRIWSVDKQNAVLSNSTGRISRSSKLHRVMRIMIDSAAVYTLSVIIFVCTYVSGNNGGYATSDNVVQIVGMSFNLIIIRVNSGKTYDGTTAKTAGTLSTVQPVFAHGARQNPNSYPLSLFNNSTMGETKTGFSTDTELTGKGVKMDVEVVRDGQVVHQTSLDPAHRV